MKILVPFFLFIISSLLFAQPAEYQSRGAKSYLVNYGAIGGNPFLSGFAAKRFVLVDEGGASDIRQIHSFNPAMPILLYKDVVALYPSFAEYTEVNRDEFAFLHSCEPSGLCYSRKTTGYLCWLADRRSPDIIGYKLYIAPDSAGNYSPLDSIFNSTNYSPKLPLAPSWLKVKSIMKDSSEINYGMPVKIQSTGVQTLVPAVVINETRTTDTVKIHIECESIGNMEPDSVVITIDLNRNNNYDANERFKLSKTDNMWLYDKSFAYTNTSKGGYEFIVYSYNGTAKSQLPQSGSYTTNTNNRLKNDYYGFFVMNVGNGTWRKAYVEQILNTFESSGFNGLFEDDTWYKVSPWTIDCPTVYSYSDTQWKHDMFAFLDIIKSSIAPRYAYFNGLYAGDADSLLLHDDGGMTEGFPTSTWSGYVTDSYWKELANVGLKCQHVYKKAWLCLGGIHDNDPEERMYDIASYLLLADSLSMFANANNYQEFAHYPEFDIPFGKPFDNADTNVDDLQHIYEPTNTPYYVRRFENGVVVVNPNSDKYIVNVFAAGRSSFFIDNKLTIDGGRLYSFNASDTVYPKQARIYLNNNFGGNTLVSPFIDTVIVDTVYNNADGTTNVSIKALVSDSSSKMFLTNPDLPLYVTAILGSIGGPVELQLLNDGTAASGTLSEYNGSFVLASGLASGKVTFPVVAYSTTGLLSVGYGSFQAPGTNKNNILPNYSFEIDADDDGIPDMWNPYQRGFIYDTSGNNAKQGKRSVSVKNESLNWSGGVEITVNINQTEAKPLHLSGWSKAENVSGNKDNNYSLYADCYYEDGTPLYGQCASFSTGTHDWEYSQKIIQPAKPIKSITLYALFRSHTGQVWYDQLSLGEYDSTVSVPETKPENLSFEIYPNPLNKNLSGNELTIKIQNPFIAQKAQIKVFDCFGYEMLTKSFVMVSSENIINLNCETLNSGIYFIVVKSQGYRVAGKFCVLE